MPPIIISLKYHLHQGQTPPLKFTKMGCFADCLKCCSAGIGVLILLVATLGLSITSVVLGSINLNSNCTGIEQIPAYLITTGVLGIVVVLLRANDRDSESEGEDGKKKKDSLFTQLIQLAHIGVLIWGSVILFGVERPDCDRVLFDYAFAITLTSYAILALVILIGFCAIGSVCCKAFTNHCCGDGEGELTYECKCCGRICCADDTTQASADKTKTPSVIIEMPRICTLSNGTEC